jgi:hypothetical protein
MYQRVEMPMRLIGAEWRGSLIPYEVVNDVPELELREDSLRHPGYHQVNS